MSVCAQVMQEIDFDAVYVEDVIYLTTNYDYFHSLKANRHYTSVFRRKLRNRSRPMIFADLWQRMFKLNRRVLIPISRALNNSGGNWDGHSRPHKLICGHVRLGRSPTLPNDSEVRNTVSSVGPLWDFLAPYADCEKCRIFVASDSDAVRSKALQVFPARAIDVQGQIIHIDKVTQVDSACFGFEKVLADQYLLATCDVLVLTYSVFGKSAAYMRRTDRDLFLMENGTIRPLQLFQENRQQR